MNRFRPLILAVSVIAAALLAYGLWTLPRPESADAQGFSAARAMNDIEAISKTPHSVAHPEERAAVREYLIGRLEEMGGNVTLYQYDSLVGPKNRNVEYTFDAVNICAEFSPLRQSADTTYLMLVAHYDSRYVNVLPRGEVWSYGAADDGYGLGVILETVDRLLKERRSWYQGVKVLFTDAEEVGLMGMEAAWENDRELFDNVGLLINIEARGTWGPVLLFETNPGNSKVVDLYASAAAYPYTYSLTTIVYQFMPNYTDFMVAKDEIPGMNFSSIADINTYHTDKDCFENTSARTVQHYGEQILPVAQKYVSDPIYSDKDYLKSAYDNVFFTVPLLGIFSVSKAMYLVINAVIFLVFILLFAFEGLRGRVKAMSVFRNSCVFLCVSVGVLAFGELVAYLCSIVAGARFKLFGTIQGIGFDNIAMATVAVITAVATALIYYAFRKNVVRQSSSSMRASAAYNAAAGYAYNNLYAMLALLFILSMALVFTLGENLMLLIPLTCAVAAMILWHLTTLKIWLPLAVFFILLHAFSFLFVLAMALTIGAFGAVLMIEFIDLMVIIPLADLYLLQNKKR